MNAMMKSLLLFSTFLSTITPLFPMRLSSTLSQPKKQIRTEIHSILAKRKQKETQLLELSQQLVHAHTARQEESYQAIGKSIQNLSFDLDINYNFSLTCKQYNKDFKDGIAYFMQHKFDTATLELSSIAQEYINETDTTKKDILANRFRNIFYIDPSSDRRLSVGLIVNKLYTCTKPTFEDYIQVYGGNCLPGSTDTPENQKAIKSRRLTKCIECEDTLAVQTILFDKTTQELLHEEIESLSSNPLAIPVLDRNSILYNFARTGNEKKLQLMLPHLTSSSELAPSSETTQLCPNKCMMAILNIAIVCSKKDFIASIMKRYDKSLTLMLFLENLPREKEDNRATLFGILNYLYPNNLAEATHIATNYFISKNDTQNIINLIERYNYDIALLAQIVEICSKNCSISHKTAISPAIFEKYIFSTLLCFIKDTQEASLCKALVAIFDLIKKPNANVHDEAREITFNLAQNDKRYKNKPFADIIMLLVNDKKDLSSLTSSLVFCAKKYKETRETNPELSKHYHAMFTELTQLVEDEQMPKNIDQFLAYQTL